MTIIECASTREIPLNGKQLDMHQLDKTFTIEEATKKYRARFGRDPEKAYLFGQSLYMVIPE